MSNRIYLSPPHMSGNEIKYIEEAFTQNWVAPLGPNVDAFEQDIASFCKVKHSVVLSSGTSALHLALISLGVQRGDEIIVSSFTFAASVFPISYLGAEPILVDSESKTWNMDPVLLEQAIVDRIEKGRKPKAIILVHLYGMPAKLDEIVNIASKYDIPIIEDAAEALGSRYNNIPVGTFGVIGIFSFNGNKILSTSGGGALVTNSHDIFEKIKYLATQARDPAPYYQHSEIGYNYRMSNIIAGIGRAQMEILHQRVDQRRQNFFRYKSALENIEGIEFLTEPGELFFSNHWLTTIVLDDKRIKIKPNELRMNLEDQNIEARFLWKPMHMQPIFSNCPTYTNGISEHLFNNGLCLPSGSNLSNDELNRVISSLRRLLS